MQLILGTHMHTWINELTNYHKIYLVVSIAISIMQSKNIHSNFINKNMQAKTMLSSNALPALLLDDDVVGTTV